MYSSLRFTGEDRHSFLQGQLTQNIDRLSDAGTLPTAWCSPKGRVLLTGRLVGGADCIRLWIPAASVESAIRRLTMYRLRAKVDFETDEAFSARAFPAAEVTERLVAAGLPAPTGPLDTARAGDIALVGTGDVIEVFGPTVALDDLGLDTSFALDDADWRRARILAACPDIDAQNAERFTPHMLNLDQLGALSFDKGCYTGQEVVARTEHLGKVKRRLKPYRITGADACVGDKLTLDDADAGEIVSVAGDVALAIVGVERHAAVLAIGDGVAEPLPLPYAID